jgi:ketosteroid isomerase-like protein
LKPFPFSGHHRLHEELSPMGKALLATLLLLCAVLGLRQPASAAPAPACREVDSNAPEWQAIGRQYARLGRAVRAKDFDAMVALYAPTFEVREGRAQGGGGAATREQSIELQRNRMALVVETRLIGNTILKLQSCGGRAVATVLQQWYRTMNVAGRERVVETAAVQDEEWVRTPAGWLRGNISNIHPGAWLIDDKRSDPSQPFRQDAPPFEPFREAPAAPVDVAPHACRAAAEGSPLWQTIGHGYYRIAEAIRNRDQAGLLALYAPESETRLADGTAWNREQAVANARTGIDEVRETRLVSNLILALEDCGNRAVATVLHQWYRTQTVQGQARRVETAAVQDEVWVSTSDGWKRGGIGNVRRGAWMVDGRRVDPNRPFDPEAPPFEPYAKAGE